MSGGAPGRPSNRRWSTDRCLADRFIRNVAMVPRARPFRTARTDTFPAPDRTTLNQAPTA